MKTEFCKQCGKEFKKDRPNKAFCSVECRNKFHKDDKRIIDHNRYLNKKSARSKPSLTLDEKIRRATALGMTYGKYVQAVEMGLIEG